MSFLEKKLYFLLPRSRVLIVTSLLKFENLDVNNSNPISPFKGCNIVDSGFVCQQLVEGCKACRKTTLSLTQCQRERVIGLASILYLSCQNCNTVTMVKTSTWHVNENAKDASTMQTLSAQQLYEVLAIISLTSQDKAL